MFEGQSPENFEQKCLCVLVVDVSSSMAGNPINELNRGLQDFKRDIIEDYVATQRLEVGIVTFNSQVDIVQEPANIENFEMPRLQTSGSTKMVDGIRKAMQIIEERKKWYIQTGQNYFRPIIVLVTDGEPDSDQDIYSLSTEISNKLDSKSFVFYSVGVKGYNHEKLKLICSRPEPLPLDGLKFSEFFRWLSNSIGIIAKSVEGQVLKLPSPGDWTQLEM